MRPARLAAEVNPTFTDNMNQPPQACPFSAASLPPMPERIRKLPTLRGFPVPWFVAKVDGEFDFRVMDGPKLVQAIQQKRCWVCGEPLGKRMSFVIGPMCGINRTNAEPPSHRECAEYSAKHCPFLTRPHMKRREDEITDAGTMAGHGIKRNPGCCAVWTVTRYRLFPDGRGGVLFDIGSPLEVDWYAEGRQATRAEVMASIESGIPLLEAACDSEETAEKREHAHLDLVDMRVRLELWLPPAEKEPECPICHGAGVIDRMHGFHGARFVECQTCKQKEEAP